MELLSTLRTAWRSWWSPYFRESEGQPLWALALVTLLFSVAIGLVLTAFSWVFSAGRLDLWQQPLAESRHLREHRLLDLRSVCPGGEALRAGTHR